MIDAGKKKAKPTSPPKPTAANSHVHEVQPVEQVSFKLFTQTPSIAASGSAADSSIGASESSKPALASKSAPYSILVDDGPPLLEGQISLKEFLDSLRPRIEEAGNEELAGSGQTTRDCPYISHWLEYYANHSAAHAERAIARFAAPLRTDLDGLREALLTRIRTAIRVWAKSGGREVESPEGIDPLGMDDRLSDESELSAVQRKPLDDGTGLPSASNPGAVRARLGSGEPLGGDVRGRMEHGFGRSFADVRLHADSSAAQLASGYAARAFTVGNHVAFGTGQYRPGTLHGDALLAHELAHTIQQSGTSRTASRRDSSDGIALEANANRTAFHAMSNLLGVKSAPDHALTRQAGLSSDIAYAHSEAHSATPALAGGLQLQRCGEPEQRYASPRTIPVATTVNPSYSAATQPAVHPQTNVMRTGGFETLIDADGDQSKELTVRFVGTGKDRLNQETGFRLELQPAWASASQSANFDLTGVFHQQFVPRVSIVTNGRDPTQFSLFEVGSPHLLLISPPEPATAGSLSYLTRLDLSGSSFGVGAQVSQEHRFTFTGGPSQTFDIFETGAPQRLGEVWVLDVNVGPFRDPFRLSFGKPNPAADPAILGISGRGPEGPIGGDSTDFTVRGPLTNVQVLSRSGAALVLDLNGDGQADLRLYDRLSTDQFQRRLDGKQRTHLFTAVPANTSQGTNAGYFQVREGRMEVGSTAGTDTRFPAASQAQAVTGAIRNQARIPDLASEIRLIEVTQASLRQRAVQAKIIKQDTFDKWAAFSADLAVIASIGASGVTPAFRTQTATDAKAFYDALVTETRTPKKEPTGKQIADDIEAQKWDEVRSKYRTLVEYLDSWIAHRASTRTDIREPVGQLRTLSKLQRELSDLKSHNPVRVAAVFHSEAQFVEQGSISEVPLSMYYWRDDDKWRIRDITNPDDTFNKDRTVAGGETEPPHELFARLEEGSHFPRGWIYYQLPSGTARRVQTTGPGALREALTIAGTALAIGGFILATGGTGAVAVVGGWALTAGAVIGASVAAYDLYERVRDGNLSAEPVILDVATIVASVSGLSAAKFGRLAVAARTGAIQGAPLVGTMARMAVWGDRLLLPLVVSNVAADVVTLGVVAQQVADQYDALDKTISDPDTRRRAKAALLTQAAVTGFFTYLSLKGNIPKLGSGRSLRLEFAPDAHGEMIPIAWPALKVTDPEVIALFSEPRFQSLFTKNPALRSQLEANIPLVEILATRPAIRDLLLARPSILESLLAHPDAVPMLREALNTVSVRTPGKTPPAGPTVTGAQLTPAQQSTKASLESHLDPGGKAQPDWNPPHGTPAEVDAYRLKYLTDLFEKGALAQAELEPFAEALAGKTRGTAAFRPVKKGEQPWKPDLKSAAKDKKRSMDKILDKDGYNGDASQLNDLAAASVTYENISDLFRGLAGLEAALKGTKIKLVYFNDRITKPMDSGYADIQMNLRMSNGHVAEFRLHLKSVEAFAANEHALYEVRRSFKPVAQESNRPLTPDEVAIDLALEQMAREGYIQALKASATPTP